MSDVLPFVQCLVCLDPTTLRRLVVIVSAVLAMTGRVTMLGICRWTEGSYWAARVDRVDGCLRIIDYKTGSAETSFSSIEALFDPDQNCK